MVKTLGKPNFQTHICPIYIYMYNIYMYIFALRIADADAGVFHLLSGLRGVSGSGCPAIKNTEREAVVFEKPHEQYSLV